MGCRQPIRYTSFFTTLNHLSSTSHEFQRAVKMDRYDSHQRTPHFAGPISSVGTCQCHRYLALSLTPPSAARLLILPLYLVPAFPPGLEDTDLLPPESRIVPTWKLASVPPVLALPPSRLRSFRPPLACWFPRRTGRDTIAETISPFFPWPLPM